MKAIVISFLASVVLQASALGEQQANNSVPTAAPSVATPASATPNPPAKKASAAQTEREPGPAPVIDYRFTNLVLSPGKPVSGVESSFGNMVPVQCTADGGVLMEIPNPQDFKNPRAVSLSLKGGPAIRLLKPSPTFTTCSYSASSPSGSDVVFLVVAAGENKITEYAATTFAGKTITGKTNGAKHYSYAVRYGLDGQYKSTTKLPEDQIVTKIAALGSDQLLALSYDRVNRVPLLRILDSSGRQVGTVLIPEGLANSSEITQGQTGDSMSAGKAATSVSAWQFIPARGNVLIFRPQSNAPIVELSSGGFRREVTIATPKEYELDGFIPSTKGWFARFRKLDAEAGADSSIAGGNYALAELNPSDGSIERFFKMESGSYFDIACEIDGEFIGYSTDEKGFLLSSTDVPH